MPAPRRPAASRTGAGAVTARAPQGAEQLWTRAPQAPTRYRLHTRLADMAHGWIDGKRGLPRVPDLAPVSSANGAGGQTPGGHLDEMPTEPFREQAPPPDQSTAASAAWPTPTADQAAAMPPVWLQTPRMQVLCARALELIGAEEQACIRDCAAFKRELAEFRSAGDAAREELVLARARLADTQRPPGADELSSRRLAEQDVRARPDAFVRKRRGIEWERRLAAAASQSQSVVARLATATRDAELREELIKDRMAVARAAAHRHHEFHLRRIATYLQQLVRSHKRGEDLNMLVMRYPVGPDMPEWTRVRPAALPPGDSPPGRPKHGPAEQNGSTIPPLSSEMSSQ